METAYFDTSALVKHYVAEIGSGWVKREGTLASEAYSRLLTAFDYDITYKYVITDVMPATVGTACRMSGRHPLRAYDAVHLATAWLLNCELLRNGRPPLTFACADDRLISIARAEGLVVENPNHHP
ncbi:MAG TPA: hypothetical protein ENK58_08155 [Desulfobacterales bacterium]|nr:MAG: hypothetical protein DRI57_03810 [Deltaproteobacteria bacterium]HHC25365.1 hypothetical protein [Desulfobacterales bacterium]